MKHLPKYIVSKLESYHNHSQQAEKLRAEIEEWFIKQGMGTLDENTDYPITDILVDTAVDGDIENAIILLEKELDAIE